MQNEKYVVFKRDEWERWVKESGSRAITITSPDEVEDAVVIRRQDVFAPPALDAYANAITVSLCLAHEDSPYSRRELSRLQDIADYFHEQAQLAWETDRKIPD